jgi:hypothetical protein
MEGIAAAKAKGVYKGRLVDERAAAQPQVDKSFLKSGICAIAFQFGGFSRALAGPAAKREGCI